MSTNPMHAQVLLLAIAQALFQTAAVMVMAIGGLAGTAVAPSPELATLPIAAMFLGTAIAIVPAATWMTRVGRRAGFMAGAGLGIVAGLLAAAGAWIGSIWLLSAGTLFVGMYQATGQFYRFAAGEVADDAYRPRAISLVLAGGVVAAVLGPWLGRWGGTWGTPAYAGSFLVLIAIGVIALLVLWRLRVPAPPAAAQGAGRPLKEIVLQPAYLVALFGAATGYAVMIMAMTATPLAMVHHHHNLSDATTVLQLHFLGMFVPSFFTGSLIARFGVLRVMMAGVAILAVHVMVTLTGTHFQSFAVALVLLGVGWNFLYVGGTTLLTTTYKPVERGRAQAANDMTVFAAALCSSLVAAPLLNMLGWQAMNLVLLPLLAAAALAIGALGWVRWRAAPVQG
ncbi:MAG TPA: MFS transporter [Ramlibacter sp.]|nr:MFS transporter [Ramlibacter sp.]